MRVLRIRKITVGTIISILLMVLVGLLYFYVHDNKEQIKNWGQSGVQSQTSVIYEKLATELKECKAQLQIVNDELVLRIEELQEKDEQLQSCNSRLDDLEQNTEENAEEINKLKPQIASLQVLVETLSNQVQTLEQQVNQLNVRIEKIGKMLLDLKDIVSGTKIRLSGGLKNNCSSVGQVHYSLGETIINIEHDADILILGQVWGETAGHMFCFSIVVDGNIVRTVKTTNTSSQEIVNFCVSSLTAGEHEVDFVVYADYDNVKVTIPNYTQNTYTIIEL